MDLEKFFNRANHVVLAALTRFLEQRLKSNMKVNLRRGRGPWWNSGAPHMNQAFPKRYFEAMGLPSLQRMRLGR